jgi:ATP phosphoribosyltransferase regulatory subunit
MSRKDEAELDEIACDGATPHADAIRALLSLHGGAEALDAGARLLASTPAADAVARLRELFSAAVARGLGAHLQLDLGEVRGFAYYTGPIFHLYAPGPGEAIGSGGRYDDLLARFGAPMPAVGFALDLDRLSSALRAAGAIANGAQRVVVVGAANDPRVAELRARGVAAVAVEGAPNAMAYARAWGFTHVLEERLLEVKGSGTE